VVAETVPAEAGVVAVAGADQQGGTLARGGHLAFHSPDPYGAGGGSARAGGGGGQQPGRGLLGQRGGTGRVAVPGAAAEQTEVGAVQRLGDRGVHHVQQLDLDNLGRAFCKDKAQGINYKDAGLLRKFISDRGKIRPRRVSGNCRSHQRDVAMAVKNAREVALLLYASVGGEKTGDRRRDVEPNNRR
jgi:small subunit ribosomal protein S18